MELGNKHSVPQSRSTKLYVDFFKKLTSDSKSTRKIGLGGILALFFNPILPIFNFFADRMFVTQLQIGVQDIGHTQQYNKSKLQ